MSRIRVNRKGVTAPAERSSRGWTALLPIAQHRRKVEIRKRAPSAATNRLPTKNGERGPPKAGVAAATLARRRREPVTARCCAVLPRWTDAARATAPMLSACVLLRQRRASSSAQRRRALSLHSRAARQRPRQPLETVGGPAAGRTKAAPGSTWLPRSTPLDTTPAALACRQCRDHLGANVQGGESGRSRGRWSWELVEPTGSELSMHSVAH